MCHMDDDFHSLFEPRMLDRGEAYYDAGRVDRPEEVAGGLWHAVVRGSEDYQVDVRLRHGRLVSAACTCPYARRNTSYCKHVAGVMFAMDAGSRHAGEPEGIFPGEASRCVEEYLGNEFPGRGRMKEMDWRTVRILLEKMYRLPDLDGMLAHSFMTASREKGPGRGGPASGAMRSMSPGMSPTRLDELPHAWLTLLEAAYEHLHDEKGLRRLYAYYILIARTDPESTYVGRLRRLSGDHWREDRDMIVALYERHGCDLPEGLENPAYERLLREERLPEAAFLYADDNSRDVMMRMLDVIAWDPECAWMAKHRLLETLHDSDSDIYADDGTRSVGRVGRWIRRIESAYGYDEARAICTSIIGMFPRRMNLRHELSEYLVDEHDACARMNGAVGAVSRP
ncbi:SWIM zinc finger family protein [Bifidobacterium platyrrhinorum]|uniref:SWIM-type domain-containing protein n=1 Tax=Bifidobacterium platyrrhinorum TaxID=2661628 RepID=A0A6L9SQX4_9BIFI|nr:SWIM zinc finger family protein [Bifidobacterium platyrrhinorum]NEG54409.1 hypothetical protein [Bifidobacterium platyrrhinorum]